MAKKLNEEEFRKLVRKIIKENVEDLGDSMEQDLNQMDGVNTKDHPNTLIGAPENKNEPSQDAMNESKDVVDAGDATEVSMNSMDKDTGKDSKAAVSIKAAGGTHSGDSVEGMSKSKVETKSGMNDSDNENGGDDKGEDATEVSMNSMDKEVDEGTKTFVEAGSEDSTGQKDAKFSEEAKNEKADEPIATAIQLPENFGKEPMSSSELMKMINEEAARVSKLL